MDVALRLMRRNPLSAEMQRLTAVLDQENKDITRAQSALSAASAHANAGFTNHTIRGELLDTLAKMMSQRKQLEQQLEDDANLMQAIKDEIADLLNKLANCAPPSTTQSPGPEPQNQQPTPPSKPSPIRVPNLHEHHWRGDSVPAAWVWRGELHQRQHSRYVWLRWSSALSPGQPDSGRADGRVPVDQ